MPTKKGTILTIICLVNWCQLVDFFVASRILSHHSYLFIIAVAGRGGGFLFVEISSSTWWHSIRQSWIVYKICRVSKCWQECNVPHKHQDIQIQRKSKHIQHTVDGRNPAPVDMENLSLFTGFYNFIHLKRLFWISSINRIIKQLTFLDVPGS